MNDNVIQSLQTGQQMPFDKVRDALLGFAAQLTKLNVSNDLPKNLFPGWFLLDKLLTVEQAVLGKEGDRADMEFIDSFNGDDVLPPEYFDRSGQLDERAQIYALGIVGYRLLTGRQELFTGNSLVETMTKRLRAVLEPVSQFCSDCPKVFEEIIMKSIRSCPEDRYSSMEEFQTALAKMEFNDKRETASKERTPKKTLEIHKLEPTMIISSRYEIVRCLGAGSLGIVYLVRHLELKGHPVAMKVLFKEFADDAVVSQRLRNEIVASYGVSHPNVVRAYEYFRDGDIVALTMEYVDGGDLGNRINADNPIPIDDLMRMLTQLCSGLQAIHDAGIVHRDLKPENILLTLQGDIKITDFGIARAGGGPRLTEHGGVVGTIDYVSPEYLEKSQVDARSDIYALGVIAYEMITGESPFTGQTLIETMSMRLRSDPRPPQELRSDCSETLSNIVLRAMARDPNSRFQTAHEMGVELARAMQSNVNH